MLTNREGVRVDPVPFLVVTGLAFLLCLSLGPIYLGAVAGLDVVAGVGWSLAVFTVVTAGAWHRFVWTRRPITAQEIPPERRIQSLYYGTIGFTLLLLLLMLPLL